MIRSFYIKDLKRICKLACARQGASRIAMKDVEIIHFKGVVSIYFTNSIFAGRLEIPSSALPGIKCDCSFMPDDFLKSCSVKDQCRPEYLRDIHHISISEDLSSKWHLQYEGLKHTIIDSSRLYANFSNCVLSDLFRFAKQMGFANSCIDISDKRPALIQALDDDRSLEFIVMPIIR